jgi:hypothetical protein
MSSNEQGDGREVWQVLREAMITESQMPVVIRAVAPACEQDLRIRVTRNSVRPARDDVPPGEA